MGKTIGVADPHDERAPGEPTSFTCPTCGGVLRWDESGQKLGCASTGHEFSIEALPAAHAAALDRAVGMALRLLDEHATMLGAVADARAARGEDDAASELRERADAVRADSDLLWDALQRRSGADS